MVAGVEEYAVIFNFKQVCCVVTYYSNIAIMKASGEGFGAYIV